MPEKLGTAVIVNGRVVAWFADFDESSEDWCLENYFGQWLTWGAEKPNLNPLSQHQLDEIRKEAEELSKKFRESQPLPLAD